MKINHLKRYPVLLALALLAITASCAMFRDMQAMKAPRYEPGKHKGAAYCGGCHKDIYGQ
ncbi:MAG: hypothetical protein HZB29_11365 [Nitrospinae bacterium]|nr:hypothetical protein [Nitrospinota bacterium]